MSVVLTYNGYVLLEDNRQYQSIINGSTVKFDTVYMFKQYVDRISR